MHGVNTGVVRAVCFDLDNTLWAIEPVLQRAVHLRSPYVDALSLLQLRALSSIRASGSTDPQDADHTLLLLAVNGVAAGLQNTG